MAILELPASHLTLASSCCPILGALQRPFSSQAPTSLRQAIRAVRSPRHPPASSQAHYVRWLVERCLGRSRLRLEQSEITRLTWWGRQGILVMRLSMFLQGRVYSWLRTRPIRDPRSPLPGQTTWEQPVSLHLRHRICSVLRRHVPSPPGHLLQLSQLHRAPLAAIR